MTNKEKKPDYAACPGMRVMELLQRDVEAVVEGLLPPSVVKHLKDSRREALLAMRSLIDGLLEKDSKAEDENKSKKIEIE